jgi:cell cycle sensor histidine kinase DivJ
MPRLAILLDRLRSRAIDALRGGAAFAAGEGAAVALIEPDGRIVSWSGAPERLFAAGRTAHALQGLVAPADAAMVERAARAKAVATLAVRARRPDGSEGQFDIRFQRRPDGRAAALLIDRTSERDSAARLAEEVARARQEGAAASARLADLSHEMRTPLNAVIGFAETIARETFGPLPHPKYHQYAEHIRDSGRHLFDLVSQTLDLSRIEADRYALARVKADPGAIARECAGIMGRQIEEAGLVFRVEIDDALPECWLDARAVRQILINLLANAAKFTAAGEVRFSVSAAGDDILFRVSDDGVGMNAQALEKLGARFTAAQSAGVRGESGAGVGLALAIALAERHGGAIAFKSAPGEGLDATVRLPAGEAPAPQRNAEPKPPTPPSADPAVLTQLDRVEAYRREVARRRAA